MKLVIFPGGGNPDSELYAKVYGLLAARAGSFGYSSVDTSVRWPGHTPNGGQDDTALTLQGALSVAASKLAECERSGVQYDILARSFGSVVALKVTMANDLHHLRRLILWGPSPFWQFWQLFVRDLEATKTVAATKGLLVDRQFFPSVEPVESLLQETKRRVVIVSGAEDKYSTPAFNAYLMQLGTGIDQNILFRSPVKGAPHEVTADLPMEVVETYLNSILFHE